MSAPQGEREMAKTPHTCDVCGDLAVFHWRFGYTCLVHLISLLESGLTVANTGIARVREDHPDGAEAHRLLKDAGWHCGKDKRRFA